MQLADFTANMGLAPVWLVLSGLFSVCGVVLGSVFVLQGRRVPPAALAIAALLPGLVGSFVAAWGISALVPSLGHDALIAGISEVVALRLLAVFAVAPGAVIGVALLAFVGARAAPRRVASAVVAAVLVLLVCAVTALGGYIESEPYPYIRAMGYAVIGIPTAVAMLAGDPEGSAGPEAGAAAGLVFGGVVAVGEMSGRALVMLYICLGPSGLTSVEQYQQLADMAFADVLSPLLPWSYASMGLGGLVGLVATAGLLSRDDPSWPNAIAAAATLSLLPVMFFVGAPGTEALVVALSSALQTP